MRVGYSRQTSANKIHTTIRAWLDYLVPSMCLQRGPAWYDRVIGEKPVGLLVVSVGCIAYGLDNNLVGFMCRSCRKSVSNTSTGLQDISMRRTSWASPSPLTVTLHAARRTTLCIPTTRRCPPPSPSTASPSTVPATQMTTASTPSRPINLCPLSAGAARDTPYWLPIPWAPSNCSNWPADQGCCLPQLLTASSPGLDSPCKPHGDDCLVLAWAKVIARAPPAFCSLS